MSKQLFQTVLLIIGFFFPLLYKTLALTCYTCFPCTSGDSGTSQLCDEKPYETLPDKGDMSCMYEIVGDNSNRKKGCRWLRNDPDEPPPAKPRPQHCTLSPYDDKSFDCYCFTDDCNEGELKPVSPTTPGPPGTPGGNTEPNGEKEVPSSSHLIVANMYGLASALMGVMAVMKNLHF